MNNKTLLIIVIIIIIIIVIVIIVYYNQNSDSKNKNNHYSENESENSSKLDKPLVKSNIQVNPNIDSTLNNQSLQVQNSTTFNLVKRNDNNYVLPSMGSGMVRPTFVMFGGKTNEESPILSPTSGVNAAFTTKGDGKVAPAAIFYNFGAWSFQNVAAAYGLQNIACVQGGVPAGSGAVIAIVVAYSIPTIKNDLKAALSSTKGIIPGNTSLATTISNNLTIVPVNSSGQAVSSVPQNAGWGIEASMDVQTIVSLCPGAKVYLVQANSASINDMVMAVKYAVETLKAQVVNMSWGGSYPCSNNVGVNAEPFSCLADQLFANYPNVIFAASAGDSGAQTGWPMAHPNVVSIGGTTLNMVNNTSGTSTQSGWKGSGGGPDSYYNAGSYQQQAYGFMAKRQTPDIAFLADPASGVWVYDTTGTGTKPWAVYGGTSLAAPVFAAIVGLINSARIKVGKSPLTQTQLWNGIYGSNFKGPSVILSSPQSTYFQPITIGNNSNALAGWDCTNGYDFVTGMGSTNTTFYNAMIAL